MTEREQRILTEVSELSKMDDSLYQFYQKKAGEKLQVRQDRLGAVSCQSGKIGPRILILFRACPASVMVIRKKKEKEAGEKGHEVTLLGHTEPEALNDSMCCYKGREVGVLRKNDKDSYILEEFPDTSFNIGEICEFQQGVICKANKLYGFNLSASISCCIMSFCITELTRSEKYINFTLVNEALAGENGYIEAVQRVKPDFTLLVSLIPDQETCRAGRGPAIAIKDGNGVVSAETRRRLASAAEDIPVQWFIGKTDRVLELISTAGTKSDFGEICMPVRFPGHRNEEIIWDDVEKTQNLLLKILSQL